MLNLGPVWGIDVGDSALKAVKLKRVGKQMALLDFQIIRYADLVGEPGARREGHLAEALVALQNAGLGKDRCVVSIGPQSVFSRFISLPPVDKRRVPEIVLYEARQQIPFSLEEVVWAYETVRKEFIPGEEIEIGLFAAKREVIDGYLGELAPLWKQIHGIQVGPLALYNFVQHEVPLDKPTVVVDIGAQSTDLLIIDGGKFWLRNLPIAGNSFTSILEKRLNIPRAEAEKLKLGIADSRHRRKLLEVIRPVMRDLLAEVQRSVGYYKSLSQSVKFDEILVTGEGYRLFSLDRFLAEQLQYQVRPINSLKNIIYQGPPERLKDLENDLPSLTVAIGLGLQAAGQSRATINLLPEQFVIRRELNRKRFNGLIAAALVWASIVSLYFSAAGSIQELQKIADSGEKTLKDYQVMKKEYDDAEQGGNQARLDLYESLGKHRQYSARIIGAIGAVVPREIQIDSFKISPVESATIPALATDRTPTPEETDSRSKVQAAKIILTFKATCDITKPAVFIEKTLRQQMDLAFIYWQKPAYESEGERKPTPGEPWQKVPLVTGTFVGPVQRIAGPGGAGYEGRTVIGGMSLQTADVAVGLITAQEADELAKKLAAEAAVRKDAEDARAKAEAERKAAEARSEAPATGR